MIEGPRLASLVASKVCHDMVEPMNALLQGLDMLRGQEGGRVNPDALRLIEHGVNKAWAKLDFFRNALAGGLSGDGDASLEEIRATATRLYSALKPELVWAAPPTILPRAALRVTLNLMLIAAECLPKGGSVTLDAGLADASGGALGEVRLVCAGARAALRAETSACLNGETPEHGFQAYNIQPALTGLLARQAGVQLAAREAPERIELLLRAPTIRVDAQRAA